MKKFAKGLIPLTTLAIILLSTAPLTDASTLTVNLNPTTGLARVNSVSTTKIVFTYPAGSAISKYLENVSSSVKLNSSFAGNSEGALQLQGSFERDDDGGSISVSNMTVSLDYTASGNATTLVINKVTNVSSWVKGVFQVANNTVSANLRWRSFVVTGAMNLDMQGDNMDVNTVGSAVQSELASSAIASAFLMSSFGDRSIWDQPTLNFSALSTPLSTWNKNYDAATNTTTFSKTISGTSTLTSSLDVNGQSYALSVVSDPSGVVTVQGYANAQGDSLVMAPAPAMTASYAELGAIVVLLAAAAGYFLFRWRAKPKGPLSTNTTPQS